MGTTNIGTKLDNLTIYVQTNQPYYSPCALVDGSVYMDVYQPIVLQCLDLCMKGKERVKWMETRMEGGREVIETKKDKKEIFNHTVVLYNFNGTLEKGQYQFPFSFQLPDHIPGSFNIKLEDHEGQVKYTLIGMLYAGIGDPIKYRSELVIRQTSAIANYNTPVLQDRPVSACCKNLGRCVMKCWFQSDSYQPGQEAMLMCAIDNRQCQTSIKNFDVSLNRTVSFTPAGHNVNFRRIVTRKQFPGISGGAENLNNPRLMSLRLEDQANFSKKIPLQPNVHGTLIDCKYDIEVTPIFDFGCGCCADSPKANIALYIYAAPLHNWIANTPSGFHPQQFDQTQIIIPVGSLQVSMTNTVSVVVNPNALQIQAKPPSITPGPVLTTKGVNVEMKVEDVKVKVPSLAVNAEIPNDGLEMRLEVENPDLRISMDGSRSELAGPNPDGNLVQIEADSVVFSSNLGTTTNLSL